LDNPIGRIIKSLISEVTIHSTCVDNAGENVQKELRPST